MEKLEIKKEKEMKNGWKFLVEVGDDKDKIEYSVTFDKDYWEKLTDSRHVPEEVVRKSFEFLLQREPKESILREFNLKVISNYFPEYEKEIGKLLPK
ncbi:hypothetical protein IH779_02385 [Patescibacteria group bacterium]|nr:hypothetical protein [Patescibacteria group bacterium]